MDNAAVRAAGPVEERFATTGNRWLGIGVVVACVLLSVGLMIRDPGRDAETVVACVGLSLLSWVALVRPVVAVHQHGLLLRNMVRDTFIPAAQIERCRVFQTIQVATPSGHFHGLGVGRSARAIVRQQSGPSIAGRGLSGWGLGASTQPLPVSQFAQEQTGGTYTEYVESRIVELGARAKRPDDQEPVVAWVWPSVAALVVAVGCFVSLFLEGNSVRRAGPCGLRVREPR